MRIKLISLDKTGQYVVKDKFEPMQVERKKVSMQSKSRVIPSQACLPVLTNFITRKAVLSQL